MLIETTALDHVDVFVSGDYIELQDGILLHQRCYDIVQYEGSSEDGSINPHYPEVGTAE